MSSDRRDVVIVWSIIIVCVCTLQIRAGGLLNTFNCGCSGPCRTSRSSVSTCRGLTAALAPSCWNKDVTAFYSEHRSTSATFSGNTLTFCRKVSRAVSRRRQYQCRYQCRVVRQLWLYSSGAILSRYHSITPSQKRPFSILISNHYRLPLI